MKTSYKRIPFDLELAKKIMNKEAKGRIVTQNGLHARIICFDFRRLGKINMIALIDASGDEIPLEYCPDGICYHESNRDKYNLHLEVPTYYRDYTNFEPQKWQPCLVRNLDDDEWMLKVCMGRDAYGTIRFFETKKSASLWIQKLPISKVTERLIGTTKSYDWLIKKLDEYEQD